MLPPCTVPISLPMCLPASSTPTLSHFWISRTTRRSATRCSIPWRGSRAVASLRLHSLCRSGTAPPAFGISVGLSQSDSHRTLHRNRLRRRYPNVLAGDRRSPTFSGAWPGTSCDNNSHRPLPSRERHQRQLHCQPKHQPKPLLIPSVQFVSSLHLLFVSLYCLFMGLSAT